MIYTDFSLTSFNTFGFNHRARFFVSLKSEDEAVQYLRGGNHPILPLLILGAGSNLLFLSDYTGTIIHLTNDEINIEDKNSDCIIISAGAGLNWDKFVELCVCNGFGGVENLSLIPGTVGATPIQNIGAYGAEAGDVILKVRGVSLDNGEITEFSDNECHFSYRNSIFKNELKGKYLITRVYFKLLIKPQYNISYGNLNDEVNRVGPLSISNIRQAVINIRRQKLPDPAIIGNAGSFFKNPVVNAVKAQNLKETYPDIQSYTDPSGGIKLSAAWMIEKCGWKGKRNGDAGVHDKQALVLVNYGNATGKEIYELSEKIRESVYEKFGIRLEREVEIVGSI